MALEEKISKHLGKPYVYLKDQKKFLCSNGVLFTLEEYKNGIDINAEYERRANEDMLYDYNYAKSTGLLRKKRGYSKMLSGSSTAENETLEKQNNEGLYKESLKRLLQKTLALQNQRGMEEQLRRYRATTTMSYSVKFQSGKTQVKSGKKLKDGTEIALTDRKKSKGSLSCSL